MGRTWEDGIFLGFHRDSNTYVIAGPDGVVYARSIMKKKTLRYSMNSYIFGFRVNIVPTFLSKNPYLSKFFQPAIC